MHAMNQTQPTTFPAVPPALSARVPPQAWFVVSAVFHYLGPAFAVLLFPAVGVLGVAWFRIASAALVFAPITRPWRLFARIDRQERLLLFGMGACLAQPGGAQYGSSRRVYSNQRAVVDRSDRTGACVRKRRAVCVVRRARTS